MLADYQAELYGFARYLTRDRAEARDLFQQTLRRAFLAFEGRPRPTNLRTWLLTIATDIILSDREHRSVSSRHAERAAEVRDTFPIRDGPLDDPTLRDFVAEFVTTLPRQQWVALVQRTYLNLDYAEIAQALSCPEDEARSGVYAALRTMRAELGDRL
jgi:RNA polymerase sigma-70 factor (ECF subfamily)